MTKFLLLNGPNLNFLEKRDSRQYGSHTLDQIENDLRDFLMNHGLSLESKQSNHEGELIDILQQTSLDQEFAGVIFNPGAYTHTSIALRDAIEAINLPVIEVHISNIHNRESFRNQSYISAVASGQVVGFGVAGYQIAAYGLIQLMNEKGER
ncbi:type II 3-dehydroquinate dehydratase [Halalkalibacillus halophilus]|uniref:type II 3-dehydroquinate dehydratase n=1 Tax=Halalkalibacillus halophilus TaxID=392827 RepID=UPI00040F2BFC|nr:type II 3-dehydroquinate dehydratase [Halalkalibacillus halophilus]